MHAHVRMNTVKRPTADTKIMFLTESFEYIFGRMVFDFKHI